MGLSRRQFTKEVKLAAVRRLEQGVSLAMVDRLFREKRRDLLEAPLPVKQPGKSQNQSSLPIEGVTYAD